jgi:hypothetical protein
VLPSDVSSLGYFERGILRPCRTSLGLFAVSTQLEWSSNLLSLLVQMTSLLSVLACILCTFSAALLLRNHTNRVAEAHAHDTVRARSYPNPYIHNHHRSSFSIKGTISCMVTRNHLRLCSHFLGHRSYGRIPPPFFLSVLLFSFTVPFLPVQTFISGLISFAACISWFHFISMTNGAAILSCEAAVAIFEVPDFGGVVGRLLRQSGKCS